jgi:hypothetical protein
MKRLLATALLLALFSAAMWFAWLGWDHQYYEVDGVAQGPYRAWQVVGCGASVVAAAVLAYVRVRTAVSAGVLAVSAAVGFALPWSWDASSDETGMWVVGLFLLVIGGSIGLGLLLTVTHLVMGEDRSPSYVLGVCGVLTVVAALVYAPLAVVPLLGAAWVFFHAWLPQHRHAGG